MSNNKSPGSDGLPKEFSLKCWDFIGGDRCEILNNTYLSGNLTSSMKLGQIKLLFITERGQI